MAVTIRTDETFTLSRVAVDAWVEKKANIAAQIDSLSSDMVELDRKIEAARVLMPSLFAKADEKNAASTTEPTVLDKVVEVLSDSMAPMTPKQIRDALATDPKVASASKNYLYTAIARGVERGLIVKEGEGYSIAQPPIAGLGGDDA